MKRSVRRHHVARLKSKRSNYWGWSKDKSAGQLGVLVNTPTPCSCWMCGNPRKYWKEATIQERKQSQDDGELE